MDGCLLCEVGLDDKVKQFPLFARCPKRSGTTLTSWGRAGKASLLSGIPADIQTSLQPVVKDTVLQYISPPKKVVTMRTPQSNFLPLSYLKCSKKLQMFYVSLKMSKIYLCLKKFNFFFSHLIYWSYQLAFVTEAFVSDINFCWGLKQKLFFSVKVSSFYRNLGWN